MSGTNFYHLGINEKNTVQTIREWLLAFTQDDISGWAEEIEYWDHLSNELFAHVGAIELSAEKYNSVEDIEGKLELFVEDVSNGIESLVTIADALNISYDDAELLESADRFWGDVRTNLIDAKNQHMRSVTIWHGAIMDVIDFFSEDDRIAALSDENGSDYFIPTFQDLELLKDVIYDEVEQEISISNQDQKDDAEIAINEAINGAPSVFTLRTLLQKWETGKLVMPDWQRPGNAWDVKKRQNLVRSVITGIPLPTIILHDDGNCIEVVDGRQRLTALRDFIQPVEPEKRYKTADYTKASSRLADHKDNLPGFDLTNYSKKYFEDLGQAEMLVNGRLQTFDLKERILDTDIPVIKFQYLTDQQKYFIFTVYNTNVVPLNAAEIRNSVYHKQVVHQMVMKLADEYEEVEKKFKPTNALSKEIIEGFQLRLKAVIGGKSGPKRLSVADFLERYCAYSLPAADLNPEGVLIRKSAASHIQGLMGMTKDWDSGRVEEMSVEIVESFLFCDKTFPHFGIDPFYSLNKNGNSILHKTKSVSSMTAAAIIIEMFDQNSDEEWIGKVIHGLKNKLDKVPEKQTGKTVWDYHLSVVNYLSECAQKEKIKIESLVDGRFANLMEAR